jgi:hypothetical protein
MIGTKQKPRPPLRRNVIHGFVNLEQSPIKDQPVVKKVFPVSWDFKPAAKLP